MGCKKMNESKKMTDGALLTAVYIGLLLIATFVPVISLFATFLLPIPFIIYASKYNWKPSLLMVAVAILLTVFFATLFSLPMTVLMALGGVMIGSGIYNGLTPYETWGRGALGFALGLLFIFLISQLAFDVNWSEEFDQIVDQSMEMSQDVIEQFGLGGGTEEQLAAVETQIEMLKNLLPVGIAFVAMLLSVISQWISYKVLNRLEKRKLHFPPFRMLQFPVSLVWIYFFTLILTFFELDKNGIIYLGVNNVLVLAGLFMTIQGFSFIFFYAHRKNMSKVLPIISVVLTFLFPMILLYLVRILGIIDIGFGLRNRLSKDGK